MTDITNQQLLDKIIDIENKMVTKDDLKTALANHPTKDDLKLALSNYPTKDDLKAALTNHPTNDDLKAFATKEDLKTFATKDDLKTELSTVEMRLTQRIKSSHASNIRHHLQTRADIGDLNSRLNKLGEGLAKAAES